jgi:hypothetical protein
MGLYLIGSNDARYILTSDGLYVNDALQLSSSVTSNWQSLLGEVSIYDSTSTTQVTYLLTLTITNDIDARLITNLSHIGDDDARSKLLPVSIASGSERVRSMHTSSSSSTSTWWCFTVLNTWRIRCMNNTMMDDATVLFPPLSGPYTYVAIRHSGMAITSLQKLITWGEYQIPSSIVTSLNTYTWRTISLCGDNSSMTSVDSFIGVTTSGLLLSWSLTTNAIIPLESYINRNSYTVRTWSQIIDAIPGVGMGILSNGMIASMDLSMVPTVNPQIGEINTTQWISVRVLPSTSSCTLNTKIACAVSIDGVILCSSSTSSSSLIVNVPVMNVTVDDVFGDDIDCGAGISTVCSTLGGAMLASESIIIVTLNQGDSYTCDLFSSCYSTAARLIINGVATSSSVASHPYANIICDMQGITWCINAFTNSLSLSNLWITPAQVLDTGTLLFQGTHVYLKTLVFYQLSSFDSPILAIPSPSTYVLLDDIELYLCNTPFHPLVWIRNGETVVINKMRAIGNLVIQSLLIQGISSQATIMDSLFYGNVGSYGSGITTSGLLVLLQPRYMLLTF